MRGIGLVGFGIQIGINTDTRTQAPRQGPKPDDTQKLKSATRMRDNDSEIVREQLTLKKLNSIFFV